MISVRFREFAATRVPLLWLAGILIFAAGGCGKSVQVRGEFPTPLVEPFPLSVGLYYEEAFRAHRHQEASEDRDAWVIATGSSQMALFGSLARGLFRNTETVDSASGSADGRFDLILAPAIEMFQFSMPRETKVNVFEVWIKYKVRVYAGDGALLVDWPLAAYGKTPTAFLRSKSEALNLAVQAALRDAGVNFVRRFAKIPEVREWLESEKQRLGAQR
ncbi:MAG: hypothetical protein OEQ18_11610 [Gammaproteobacteria bacterium]|nr:hypothetical protein [Gammaproteobacteria bacterium]